MLVARTLVVSLTLWVLACGASNGVDDGRATTGSGHDRAGDEVPSSTAVPDSPPLADTAHPDDPAESAPVSVPLRSVSRLDAMTFNIRHGTMDEGDHSWDQRRSIVVSVIRETGPTVLGLQEATSGQLDDLIHELPFYASLSVGSEDGREAGAHNAILVDTRRLRVEDRGVFWLSAEPDRPGSATWGNRQPRTCIWALLRDDRNGQRLLLLNTHLDHRSRSSRSRSLELIGERLESLPAVPTIVLGDFNMEPSDPVLAQFLRDEELNDALGTAANGQAPTSGTFHGFEGGEDGPRVDHIFASSQVAVEKAEILRHRDPDGRYPSDHFPVTATVRMTTLPPN